MIKCLIFDCDGTLVDSEYLCNLGLELKLKEHGVEESADDMMNHFRGSKLSNIIEHLEKKHQIPLDDEFIASYRILVDALFHEHLKPCQGVIPALNDIKIAKCVASSGPTEKIRSALTITNLFGYFADNFFSSYDINSWKPDPDIFLYAAEQMEYAPEHCVVIEDSPLGILAANAAGMRSVFYNPNNIDCPQKSTWTIKHMCELKRVIS